MWPELREPVTIQEHEVLETGTRVKLLRGMVGPAELESATSTVSR